ncbi:hypothetical protein [Longitalea arenae]|uniref:hypothetical protein n=1 Tax=Longitalea arenae TaxID=2812558 RepID=UPI0019671CCE|nr:hypothetical protein [Longitalea arenae]
MKFLFILIALPVLASKCNKNKENDGYLRGKVVRISCASFVVQVLNNDSFGEDGWKDMTNNNVQYDNVFTASNACKIPAGVKAGATIRFKASSSKPNDCVYCMMFDGPPTAKYDITDVMIEETK